MDCIGIVDVRGVGSVQGLCSIRTVCHLLKTLSFLFREIVPPDGTLFVKLFNLFVDELIWVLTLVLGPTSLDKHAIGSVLLFSTVLSHVEIQTQTSVQAMAGKLVLLCAAGDLCNKREIHFSEMGLSLILLSTAEF